MNKIRIRSTVLCDTCNREFAKNSLSEHKKICNPKIVAEIRDLFNKGLPKNKIRKMGYNERLVGYVIGPVKQKSTVDLKTNKTLKTIIDKSLTISDAARQISKELNLSIRHVYRFIRNNNLVLPNRGGKGTDKGGTKKFFEIIKGLHPSYKKVSYIRKNLIKHKIIEDKCAICGWNKRRPNRKFSSCELHHKNKKNYGNNRDHKLENLILLCPNCHNLTKKLRKHKFLIYKGKKYKNECTICQWNEGVCEIHHVIDKLHDDITVLCPNCHSLTNGFRRPYKYKIAL